MSVATEVSVRERVQDLIEYIRKGRILDAMTEFYADDAAMQENANPPTAGLAANVEREKQFIAGVKQWLGFEVKAVAVEGDTSFMESALEFVTTGGQRVRQEQVAVARWRDGKIAHERFYYDSAAK
jgi:ketosteroid isomerase-like protein